MPGRILIIQMGKELDEEKVSEYLSHACEAMGAVLSDITLGLADHEI